ncbi:helix-turn-helix transcriptional regulator [Mycolicibacterium vaccae]|uniref:helix-turn-helix transcriptional regulator n=1 Tax=Mycolicibacterium vaccae TaxID=1810 RepID=UPI003D022706
MSADIVLELISLRYRAGLTQAAIADRMGVSRTVIGRFESEATRHRTPTLKTLQRYAEAVGHEIILTPKRPEPTRPVRLRIICDTCRDDDGGPKHWDQTCEHCADDLLARHTAEHPDHTVTIQGRLPQWQ